MQPVGPYQFVEVLGSCQVGRVWSALDPQGRALTIAVLDPGVAGDERWREAFAGWAQALTRSDAGPHFVEADFSAAAPWVAYGDDGGPGAGRLFQALGMEYRPVSPEDDRPDAPAPAASEVLAAPAVVTAPTAAAEPGEPLEVAEAGPEVPAKPGDTLRPQSASPDVSPVSGPPMSLASVPSRPVSAPPDMSVASEPVSAPPQPVSAPPQPVSAPPQPVSGVPVSPALGSTPSVAYDPFASSVRRIDPAESPARSHGRRWIGIGAALLVLVLVAGGGVFAWTTLGGDAQPSADDSPPAAFSASTLLVPGLKPWAHAGPYSAEERALAIAAPSMVFVETIFTGYLRNRQTGALLQQTPVTFSRRCSGFVINPDGHVLTPSQCVRPAEDLSRGNAVDVLGRMLVEQKRLKPEDLDSYVRDTRKTTLFTGLDPGSEPEIRVYGQLNLAKAGDTEGPAIAGEVVQTLATLAVVKLAQENLPAAELSAATVQPEAPLIAVGYAKDPSSSGTYIPQSKSVAVIDGDIQQAVPVHRINDDIGSYSRGGMAIDPSGRIVGMLDRDAALKDQPNRAVVPAATIRLLLNKAGVTNTLGPSDRLYRAGLTAYFVGDHATAISRFNAVAKSSPTNLLAQMYRQAAVDRRSLEPSTAPAWPAWLLAGLGGALIGAGIVFLVILVKRRIRR